MKCVYSGQLLLSLTALGLWAQPQQPAPEFDVISIKANKSAGTGGSTRSGRGLYRATNVTVKSIVMNAFDLLPDQLVGAPSWVESERFDIEAKSDNPEAMDLKLRSMLATRFEFRMHRETREWQSYVLVAGKKGAKLTPTSLKEGMSARDSNGHWEGTGLDIDNFARNLAHQLGRPVVNQTGIEGRYDITLDFEPDGPARTGDKDNPIAGVDTRRPSLFTAIQDQLGLKLESRKTPVEVLVVDHIGRPSEN